jgi:hypothetical protein
MDQAKHGIQIIPDLTIDQKYTSIISEAQNRIETFIENAVKNGRLEELFELDKSGMSREGAEKILTFGGRLSVGFQFDSRAESLDENFRIFVRKTLENGKQFKFQLSPQVHDILLQLISLEDRRSVAIFSMLNSSLDMGYRILTSMYGTQLQRLLDKSPEFITGEMAQKLEKLRGGNPLDTADLWDSRDTSGAVGGGMDGVRRGSDDNILSVMADDNTFEEINQLVDQIVSRRDRIREKRRQLEENSDLPRSDLYWQMVTEDFRQLENCYARMHIYLKAFYKNKGKRNNVRNRILRQFFAFQIENITGETSLVEDLLSLNESEYFKNIYRHQEL